MSAFEELIEAYENQNVNKFRCIMIENYRELINGPSFLHNDFLFKKPVGRILLFEFETVLQQSKLYTGDCHLIKFITDKNVSEQDLYDLIIYRKIPKNRLIKFYLKAAKEHKRDKIVEYIMNR